MSSADVPMTPMAVHAAVRTLFEQMDARAKAVLNQESRPIFERNLTVLQVMGSEMVAQVHIVPDSSNFQSMTLTALQRGPGDLLTITSHSDNSVYGRPANAAALYCTSVCGSYVLTPEVLRYDEYITKRFLEAAQLVHKEPARPITDKLSLLLHSHPERDLFSAYAFGFDMFVARFGRHLLSDELRQAIAQVRASRIPTGRYVPLQIEPAA